MVVKTSVLLVLRPSFYLAVVWSIQPFWFRLIFGYGSCFLPLDWITIILQIQRLCVCVKLLVWLLPMSQKVYGTFFCRYAVWVQWSRIVSGQLVSQVRKYYRNSFYLLRSDYEIESTVAQDHGYPTTLAVSGENRKRSKYIGVANLRLQHHALLAPQFTLTRKRHSWGTLKQNSEAVKICQMIETFFSFMF